MASQDTDINGMKLRIPNKHEQPISPPKERLIKLGQVEQVTSKVIIPLISYDQFLFNKLLQLNKNWKK
eukprot:CAMPEP_0116872314 /NCGR_PEP_ID=MMETSP0463-20121206/3038_1 /TAXON_ID=181622 /ORGANISM="Strombidinopsis sp, Strain SopsisLIS2011" /LENGTH=67 /DNA_ID=CAMNT_0004512359 /DNA_START=606 /DNA_END=809 /DNA_ORIENTATION=+